MFSFLMELRSHFFGFEFHELLGLYLVFCANRMSPLGCPNTIFLGQA